MPKEQIAQVAKYYTLIGTRRKIQRESQRCREERQREIQRRNGFKIKQLGKCVRLAQRLKATLWLLQFIVRISGLTIQDTRQSYQSETSSNEPTAHLPNYHAVFASASLGQFLLVFLSLLHYHYLFSSALGFA